VTRVPTRRTVIKAIAQAPWQMARPANQRARVAISPVVKQSANRANSLLQPVARPKLLAISLHRRAPQTNPFRKAVVKNVQGMPQVATPMLVARPRLLAISLQGAPQTNPSTKAVGKNVQGMPQVATPMLVARHARHSRLRPSVRLLAHGLEASARHAVPRHSRLRPLVRRLLAHGLQVEASARPKLLAISLHRRAPQTNPSTKAVVKNVQGMPQVATPMLVARPKLLAINLKGAPEAPSTKAVVKNVQGMPQVATPKLVARPKLLAIILKGVHHPSTKAVLKNVQGMPQVATPKLVARPSILTPPMRSIDAHDHKLSGTVQTGLHVNGLLRKMVLRAFEARSSPFCRHSVLV